MKIAVTGSRGFIGSHLVKRLLDLGHKPILVQHDKLDDFEGADVIFNLMSYGNMAHQKEDDKIFNANVIKLYELLTKKHDYFINFSTSSVTLPKQTSYSATKAMGEIMVKADGGISVRPSSVTGKGEQDIHLIPTLIRSCKTGKEMLFVPEPTHDFIDVNDVVDACILLMEKGKKGEIYNISNNKKWSNQEVKEIVEKITGRQANIKNVDSLRDYDNLDWKIDNSEILKLGWKPKITLEQSILSMV